MCFTSEEISLIPDHTPLFNVLGMLVFVFERRQYLQEVLLGLLDEKY